MNERMASALSSVLHDAEDEMVLKWVCVVETVDAKGERGVWSLNSAGCETWDKIGMFGYGLQREQALMTARHIDED
jgi:hypothetical protein